jgi:hypothetical protein
MVMVRGPALPSLNGHCVDGARTRLTITSDQDSQGRMVWLVGGQLAEDGVSMDAEQLISHAQRELSEALSGFSLEHSEWTTFRIDRAEAATRTGARPDGIAAIDEHTDCGAPVITTWPTKLALVPRLAEQVAGRILRRGLDFDGSGLRDWPRPAVAHPPWETATQWYADA